MKRVFAFDLDGTLLTNDNKAHPKTLKALELSKNNNHINVIATGRGLKNVLPLFENHNLDHIDYLICSNGALIYDMKSQKYEIVNNLDPNVFPIIFKKHLKYKSILRVDFIDQNHTILPDNKIPDWLAKSHVKDNNLINSVDETFMNNLVFDTNSKITQIALRNEINIAGLATDELKKELKNYDCEVYLTNSVYTDINGKNVSKFNALNKLVNELKLETKNIVAFGDSGNDVEMLKNSGIGVAMGNATVDAKEVAHIIIGDHNTGTIGEFIEKLI
ncbi:haloacid dehalogenase [Mycoplasmopsis canis]|uniref:HAD family hydrolase n=1 Tax=Mycoplasmopsis canis TaxID=29555 RepID=UPI000624DDFB|nr:HAD family hydrolase [Mycoplasmopsis canis]AKF41488.1 haloacid dehalogenase [Mycoplasmopsis canis]